MKKKWIKGAGLLAAGFLLLPVSVQAASEKTVSLEKGDEGVQVTLELPESTGEKILSLQLSLQVDTLEGQPGEASFVFDDQISSSVKEWRYHQDTGIVNLYISGKQNLLEEQELTLGQLQIAASDEKGLKAEISVLADSLVYVNDAFTKTQEHVNAPARVQLIVGNGGNIDSPTVTPEATVTPVPTTAPEPTGSPESTTTPTPDPSITPEGSPGQPEEGNDAPESVTPQNPVDSEADKGTNTDPARTGDFSFWEIYAILGAAAVCCLLGMGLSQWRVKK